MDGGIRRIDPDPHYSRSMLRRTRRDARRDERGRGFERELERQDEARPAEAAASAEEKHHDHGTLEPTQRPHEDDDEPGARLDITG